MGRRRRDEGFVAFLKQYVPGADPNDLLVTLGYSVAQTMAQVLRQCGDELTHENVLKQALNLKNVELSLLLPGIKANTSPTEGFPIRQLQMARFDGKSWQLFGGLIGDS
jgi:branched-chain amino acid transport system substrate-binding protein